MNIINFKNKQLQNFGVTEELAIKQSLVIIPEK